MSKNYGPGVSGFRDPASRNFETTVYQAGKAVLDAELNLIQDANQNALLALQRKSFPSGWVSDNFLNSPTSELYNGQVLTANLLQVPSLTAVVNGWTLSVTNTNNNAGLNVIDLGASPSGAGTKRTDLVILEVWRRLLTASPSSTGKSPTNRIWRNGNVKIASGDDVALNFADDILDGAVAAETTKRVQIQYRLRVIQGVDLFTYAFGINDPIVLANSVPATAGAPNGTPSTFNYVNQSANGDSGLWVAGDGNTANALGTVDGYMYALPLVAVFRRNTNAFDRNANHNGGAAYPSASDRPDGYYSNIIEAADIYDLRNGTAPTNWDLQEVLQKNLNFLFENSNQTEIASVPQGGGVHGHTVLWADEIGVSNANGGNGTTTGDTPGAEFIGEFDSVRRVFSDRAVYETIVVSFTPSSVGVSPGGASWTVGTTVTISPSAMPIWPYASANWASRAPAGVTILDVSNIYFSGSSVGNKSVTGRGSFSVQGLGGVPQGSLTLTMVNNTVAITNETLYVTLLVAYPPGVGLSKTPTTVFGDNVVAGTTLGVSINNPAQLPASAPIYYSGLAPFWNRPNREIRLEYTTLSHTFSLRPSTDTLTNYNFVLPERALGSPTITINGSPYVGLITIVGYTVTIAPILVGGENVVITYNSRRALPANGEQLTMYYETRMPQTIREGLLPNTFNLISRMISNQMYVLTAGSGSEGQAYPFPYQYVQTGGVYPTSGGAFTGDHELDGDLRVSTTTLYTDTGFQQLPVHLPLAPLPNGVQFIRSPGDVDIEGRSYYAITSGYGYLAIGPSLSDPKKHKNLLAMICELPANDLMGFKGQLVLVLLSRWAAFDDVNSVGFTNSSATNSTTASVYRLKGNLLSNRRM